MDTNAITTALTTRVIDDSGYDWMLLTMGQRFYLSDRKVLDESQFDGSSYKGDQSDFLVNAQANLTKSLKFTTEYEYNFSEIQLISSRRQQDLGLNLERFLNASYRQVRNPSSGVYDVKQYLLSGQWPLTSGWSL